MMVTSMMNLMKIYALSCYLLRVVAHLSVLLNSKFVCL